MIPKLAGLFLVLVCGDMGVKQYIEDSFQEKEERETLIPSVVLRKVYNRGFLLDALDQDMALQLEHGPHLTAYGHKSDKKR